MRIGLDIDDVISDMDKILLKEFFIHDKKLRNSGIVNPNATHIVHGMFDWSKEEQDAFFAQNMERIASQMSVRRGAKKYMQKLIDNGHELYLITNRVFPHYTHPFEVTTTWLKKHNVPYTKLVISKTPDKTAECRDYKIDIMVDDRPSKCQLMINKGINCLVLKTRYNERYNSGLSPIPSWKKLYEEMLKCKKKK